MSDSVTVEIPAQRPILLGHLARRVGKRPQCPHDAITVRGWHPRHDRRDLPTPSPTDLRDQLGAGTGQRDPHRSAIILRAAARHQSLTHQAITHPRRSRTIDTQSRRQVRQTLRTPGRQFHEKPVLRQRHILSDAGQRTRRDRHQRPAGPQHRINELVTGRLSVSRGGRRPRRKRVHTTIIAYRNQMYSGQSTTGARPEAHGLSSWATSVGVKHCVAARLQRPLGNRVSVDLHGNPLPVMTARDIAAPRGPVEQASPRARPLQSLTWAVLVRQGFAASAIVRQSLDLLPASMVAPTTPVHLSVLSGNRGISIRMLHLWLSSRMAAYAWATGRRRTSSLGSSVVVVVLVMRADVI